MEIDILSDDPDIQKICTDYWKTDENGNFEFTLAQMSNTYNVKSSEIQQISKSYSIAYSDYTLCTNCNEPYTYSSRQDYKNFRKRDDWTCFDCLEIKESIIKENKYELLKSHYEKSCEKEIVINELSVKHAVFLSSLIRFAANEDLTQILAYDEIKTDSLSPTEDYSISIIRELYKNGLIAISPESDLSSIEIVDEQNFRFYISRVRWALPLTKTPIQQFILALDNKIRSTSYVDDAYDDVLSLAKEISYIECISYIKFTLEEHKFEFNPGEKTELVIYNALDNFSVSQIYSFIWRAAKDAAAFYLRAAQNKKHAANTIVSSIEKQVDRALAHNWNVSSFKRNYSMPQSAVSRTFFNMLLLTDDGGFTQQINKII
jgi:hypothetical protein